MRRVVGEWHAQRTAAWLERRRHRAARGCQNEVDHRGSSSDSGDGCLPLDLRRLHGCDVRLPLDLSLHNSQSRTNVYDWDWSALVVLYRVRPGLACGRVLLVLRVGSCVVVLELVHRHHQHLNEENKTEHEESDPGVVLRGHLR